MHHRAVPLTLSSLLILAAAPALAGKECREPTNPTTGATLVGDPAARAAAQRGLDWLTNATLAWQDTHKCFGCHVQAVTLEALTVGRANQYQVDQGKLDAIVKGMLELPGGAHGKNGFSYHDEQLFEPSKAFGGSAFAHYDERVGPRLRTELVKTAEELLAMQTQEGAMPGSYNNQPVATGVVQATTQALVTFRQVHARTADARWLVPIRKAEQWLTLHAKRMSDEGGALQELDHAVIGLVAAGAGSGDKLISSLARVIEKQQLKDGSFSLSSGQPASPFATGQAVYALRLAGRSDGDSSVKRGTAWLLAHQQGDGSWGGGGFGKAEAMWAVLGLVSLDRVSIDVKGLVDGQRIDGTVKLTAAAADNGGQGVSQMALLLDDVLVTSACGDKLESPIDAAKLGTGTHTVDVTATAPGGKVTRRRLYVHAGDAFLHEVGARFEGGKTVLGFRNLAPDAMKAKVRVRVLEDKGGKGGKEVEKAELSAAEGPMAWTFAGKQGGRFKAELSLVDATGRVRDTEELVFTHDTWEAQRASTGDVAGAVNFDGADLANTEVELVDNKGFVVQKSVTTRSGQYRFQNVDAGKYKVRVKKQGFKDWEADIKAEKAAEAAAPAAAMQAQ
ncbi:MAG: carboxypeptidase regulatory-like domain-containing protein [Deltaproteobacteria bacterium]|nr:carboxypeptidase regulatory-like domain-containing protein [Deltaproteobacteria bacterium]